MEYVAVFAWFCTTLIPVLGFMYLGARWERERTARMVRAIRESRRHR